MGGQSPQGSPSSPIVYDMSYPVQPQSTNVMAIMAYALNFIQLVTLRMNVTQLWFLLC